MWKVIFLLLWVSISVQAQEFWMIPNKFDPAPGDTAIIHFEVGNNFIGENWNLRLDRVKRLSWYDASQQGVSLRDRAHEGQEDHLVVPLKHAGTYLVLMEGNSAYIELPADQFNNYLKEYALDNAIQGRKKTGTEGKPGRERYARSTKLLLQVGDRLTDAYKASTGLPLDIIPQKNPGGYKVGDVVYFKLYFEDKPLFGARAFVWNMKNNRTYSQPIYSQQDGSIEVRVFNEGAWMVSVVGMVPAKEGGKAAWQSYWSSLVFYVE